jgi:hypothetical protein
MKMNGRNPSGLVQHVKKAKESGNAPCVRRLFPNQLLGISIHVIPEVKLRRIQDSPITLSLPKEP